MFTGTSEDSMNTRAQCVLSQVLRGSGDKRDLHVMLLCTTAPPQLCSLRPVTQLGQLVRAGGEAALVLSAAGGAGGSGAGGGAEGVGQLLAACRR